MRGKKDFSRWAKQKMASTTLLKASCSFEFCSFQTVYISPWFMGTAGNRRPFPCSVSGLPGNIHTHTCTDTQLLLLWTGGAVVIYRPCCHNPNFSFNDSITCLPPCCFLSLHLGVTPQKTPNPPDFRPDYSTSTPCLSFW